VKSARDQIRPGDRDVLSVTLPRHGVGTGTRTRTTSLTVRRTPMPSHRALITAPGSCSP